jgi:2-C-methyl-D-erythritol 4-phosphate cytidylyltransferase
VIRRAAALLVGAGRGDRLGAGEPKAFVRLAGRSLLEHAAAAADACPEVVLVVAAVPEQEMDRGVDLVASVTSGAGAVVPGGATRSESVRAGLHVVAAEPAWHVSAVEGGPDHEDMAGAPGEPANPAVEAVVVHDVARPLATPELFSAVLAGLEDADGAILALPLSDTVKRVRDGTVEHTVSRRDLALAQTPQAFRLDALVDAHNRPGAGAEEATDDAALLERAGYRVTTVPGDPSNVKITVRTDLIVAMALLEERRGPTASIPDHLGPA